MATVSKSIADKIIAGEFAEDPVIKIVKYRNAFDGEDSYGVIYKGEDPEKYKASPFVINPMTYWEVAK